MCQNQAIPVRCAAVITLPRNWEGNMRRAIGPEFTASPDWTRRTRLVAHEPLARKVDFTQVTGRVKSWRAAAALFPIGRVRDVGLTYFKRFRMEIDLTGRQCVPLSLLPGYRMLPWDDSLLELHAETKYRSFQSEIDANVFPVWAIGLGATD